MSSVGSEERESALDGLRFGHRLLRRGLITPEQLAEALKVQREFARAGFSKAPRLGEVLLARGYIGGDELLTILNEQGRDVLYCEKCRTQTTADGKSPRELYCCEACGGVLSRRSTSTQESVGELPPWFDLLPAEIQAVARDPQRVLGKYILMAEVGRGASGTVYRAWDQYLGQYVALKLIKAPTLTEGEASGDPLVQEFLREARTVVRLRHPNIVQVYDVGHVGDRYFMSMEYVDGRTLGQMIHPDRRSGGRRLPTAFYDAPREFVAILRDIARAVDYAHSRPSPVVHRDLKPANILVERSGKPYVVDFGIAKEMDLRSGVTMPGIVKGTPAYMSPEQAEGRVKDLDARTDVYALGAILYEMVVGRPPFVGSGVHEVLRRVCSEPPDPPGPALARMWKDLGASDRGPVPQVPAELERIAMRCLEKDPAMRYPRARDLVAALERYLAGAPIEDPQPPPAPTPPPIPAAVPAAPAAPASEPPPAPPSRRREPARRSLIAAGLGLAALAPFMSAFVVRTVEAPSAFAHEPSDAAGPVSGPPETWWDTLPDETRVLGARAILALDRGGIRVRGLRLDSVPVGEAEILQADVWGVVLWVEGCRIDLAWGALPPRQALKILRAGAGEPPDDEALSALHAAAVHWGLAGEAQALEMELRATRRPRR